MILYVHCSKCANSFAVSSLDPDLRLLAKPLPCTDSECKGTLKKVKNPSEEQCKISALKLFQAAGGGGMPSERSACTDKQLKTVLVGKVIKAVVLENYNSRVLVKSITLEGGKQIHFASSTKGAVVFKVTEKKNASSRR